MVPGCLRCATTDGWRDFVLSSVSISLYHTYNVSLLQYSHHMIETFRHLLIGSPLASSRAIGERLGIPLALVIVAANALSSVAYASEEILIALSRGGGAEQSYLVFITLAIIALMVLVVLTYDYVIRAYPGGGGAYVVAKENLGITPALIAAGSLLVDYTLTVSVSVTAGAAALVSAFPGLDSYRTWLAVLLVAALTLVNLRGARQSAQLMAPPVYFFIGSLLLMIGVGVYRYIVEGAQLSGAVAASQPDLSPEITLLGFLVLLRAFASGCVALTGVEAISNTLAIFRPPETRNARITLVIIGLLLASLFLGVSVLAHLLTVTPVAGETLVSQVARASFGNSPLYYFVQFSTLFILIVAANTSFSAFPQLSARLARDGFLPRPLSNLGDRLVFSNGILLLAGFSVFLIAVFQGDTHQLIPLYAIGVFVGFTLTQVGMTVYWWRRDFQQDQDRRRAGWWHGLLVSGLGAGVTAVVLIIVVVEKFTSGAWLVIAAMPFFLLLFMVIRGHYQSVAEALSLERYLPDDPTLGSVVVIPIGGVHRAVIPFLEYARLIGTQAQAVHIAVDEEAAEVTRSRWERLQTGIPLVIIPSPYREVVRPLVQHIREVARAHPSEHITVVIPEFVPKRWWQRLLHNQTAYLIKLALRSQPGIIVVSVPYYLPN